MFMASRPGSIVCSLALKPAVAGRLLKINPFQSGGQKLSPPPLTGCVHPLLKQWAASVESNNRPVSLLHLRRRHQADRFASQHVGGIVGETGNRRRQNNRATRQG